MPARIKKKLNALKLSEMAKPRFFKLVEKEIKERIVALIENGISPVKKGGIEPRNTGGKIRFQKYSDSYTSAMGKGELQNKKQRPVNLKLTGKMLNSIKSRRSRDKLTIWFSDKKAKYHNDLGAGKAGTIRRILPRSGEQWEKKIEDYIVKALEAAIKTSQR